MSASRVPPEAWTATGFSLLAGIGWWLHSLSFALVGMTGMLLSGLFYIWQRDCLTAVAYRRRLSHDRASFGEEISLEIEILNDKLLPLTWLHIEDDFPSELSLEGGLIVSGRSGIRSVLVQVLAMFPFGRVRRRMSITCDRRGLHTIGPAKILSGNPFGYRQRSVAVRDQLNLLVYPKVFELNPPGIVAGVPLGDQRVRALLHDPSRASGVRDYRPGDPLRTIDWRATARSGSLLVREFESTASERVVLFADLTVRGLRGSFDPAKLEFVVAVVASVVAELAGRGISVGIYSGASADGNQVAYSPSCSPTALSDMLELLAKTSPYGIYGGPRFADIVLYEGARLSSGTSALIVASDFDDATVAAMSELCRRAPVTTLWVDTGSGHPAPDGLAKGRLNTRFIDDWKRSTTLELAL
jgi:uncharacterized protein (DUF58 family)